MQEYHVALSFAGEDREQAKKLACLFKKAEVHVKRECKTRRETD